MLTEIKDLNYYYNKFKYGEDIFHNLMHFRVRDILLVSTFYDAFILEQDGRLSEKLFGDFKELDLSNYPRIVTVPTGEQALEELNVKDFDLVITLENIGKLNCLDLVTKIKESYPQLPVLLLLNKTIHPGTAREFRNYFDGVFKWEGDATIFLSMIKITEDRKNLQYDTENGLVRVILLYENSVRYYSRFLPQIYYELVQQTQRLIQEEYSDVNKRLRMRGRPKVIIANNYEQACELYDSYSEFISCVIASSNGDENEPKSQHDDETGIIEPESGFKLLKKIRENDNRTSLLLHSSDPANDKLIAECDIYHLNDESPSFWRDFRTYLHTSLGFGDFTFRDDDNVIYDKASSMSEFAKKLRTIDDSSLRYHAKNNHFSTWMLAHGEFQVAREIGPKQISDFSDVEALREYLISVFQYVKRRKNRGKIVSFNEESLLDEKQIVRLADGSLGGKGRGLAFLNALMETMDFQQYFSDMLIRLPRTAIIGTNEFDLFIENNGLNLDFSSYNDEEIDRMFIKGSLSDDLMFKLKIYARLITKPIAVRSSGLLEDSQSQPFAGVYRTYMLPNSSSDIDVRITRLANAIKMVFASIYLKNTRNYIEGINYKIEEEKMAVILQEMVGEEIEQYFYPHLSGVAQSYNYYPTSYLKHDDGIASLAVGLGKSVVDREKTLSFCPKYPRIDFMEPFRIVENSQRHLYAIDLRDRDIDLCKGEDETLSKIRIGENAKQNALVQLTSVWDYENNTFIEGTYAKGPRVITFRSITHYSQLPLSEILNAILEIGEKAMGIPVEIEFAMIMNAKNAETKAIFHLLQIRPINVNKESLSIELTTINKEKLLLYSTIALGNGLIDNIYDIIYIDPEKFDNNKTLTMREEIEMLNEKMKQENRYYILLGPGRWGSSDRFLGVPVKWGQINRAKVIVEIGLKNFIVEASQGSHFFQNVFAMNVGYFTVPFHSEKDLINWDWLKQQKPLTKTEYCAHVRTEQPLIVKIDGKKGHSAIEIPEEKAE
jgi:hypothetical protein